MQSIKIFLIWVVLILVAFGIGYGWGYIKLRNAQKGWMTTKNEMEARISILEKDLVRARARETLREMSSSLSQVINHLGEKNFGLTVKAIDGLKESFIAVQSSLDEEWKSKFDFFLPALEEIRKEAENLTPQAKKNTEELKVRFDQALGSLTAGK